jgi:hypothetical protein
MHRLLIGFLGLSCFGLLTPAFSADSTPKVLIDDARVIATEVGLSDAMKSPTNLDRVIIDLSGGAATFVAKGTPVTTSAARMIAIQIKDANIPPLPNASGLPEAFPRPNVKKLLENNRVAVWDYTWTRDQPPPTHFHSRHAIVTYLGTGVMRSTDLKGEIVDSDITYGLVKSNLPARTHTESIVSGNVRAVIVELK